jgi:hypothetical protein
MRKLKGWLLAALLTLAGSTQAYVTLKQIDGRWWFMDGSKKFFSVGSDCVEGCYGHYEEKPLAPERKAGALKLMNGWGFNSAGGWSSPSVWDSLYFADQIYPPVNIEWDDLFDPALWTRFDTDIVKELTPFLKKPKFMGYFLSNEPAWKAEPLFNLYRAMKPSAPGSQALVKFAQTYYKNDLARLNREWGTSFSKFEALAGSKEPAKPTEMMEQKFFKAWRIEVAAYFYKQYAAAVRKHDPDHLILGIRAAGMDPEFLIGISGPFDAVSANVYDRFGEVPQGFAEINKATGKPCMVTEWSFSSYPAAGSKSLQYIEVFSEAAKGFGYTKFIKNLATAPFMVGSHWFLYEDYDKAQVMLGPYYPDEAMGLVSAIDGTPHKEFGEWAKKANQNVEAWHSTGKWNSTPTPTPEATRDFPALTPKLDGKLDEWGPAQLLKTGIGHSLYANVKPKDRYYLAKDKDFVYVAGEVFDDHINAGEPGWNWECDYLGFKLFPPAREDGLDHKSYFAILPTGGAGGGPGIGADAYVHPWTAAKDPKAMAKASVVRLYTRTGFTFEAAIPVAAIIDFNDRKKDQVWMGAVLYHNTSDVYETYAAVNLKIKD